jgi:hypothetical protein
MVQSSYTAAGKGNLIHLSIWTDNCSAQFKCQWQFGWLVQFAKKVKVFIDVNFFCPQHGKGAPDGQGATIKHTLERYMGQSPSHILPIIPYVYTTKY